ncbi:MAG: hypothetical protein EXQ56_12745 [Acidobacteria bacterium]|nr:hypothetical protein [Acidobacteriota bacterium]
MNHSRQSNRPSVGPRRGVLLKWMGSYPVLALLLLSLASVAPVVLAQEPAPTPAPAAEVRKTISAVFTDAEITVDGELNETAWAAAVPARDFTQRDPDTGAPASEPSEIRILYDRENLYIGVYCHESDPRQIIVNNIRRDFPPNDQDAIAILLDTFHDRRSGYTFSTTPEGGQRDQQFTDTGRVSNPNWDGVWYSESKIHKNAWTAEFAIPFKTLRFSPEDIQLWGVNFYRYMQHNGEANSWAPLPRRYVMQRGVGIAGDLVGLKGVKPGKNLYIKPYVLGGAQKLDSQGAKLDGEFKGGMDLKYGVAPGMTLDLTANTDFSDTEADTQQINFTRFPLFFPEKREFFLENAGLFQAGFDGLQRQEVLLFHSRRIGLAGGTPIPILGGARLSGRAGKNAVGLMNIQTRSEATFAASNFTVARFRRDILSNSTVGAIVLNRRASLPGDSSQTYGVDATMLLRQDLQVNALYAKTRKPQIVGEDGFGKFEAEWQSNLWRLYSSYSDIQKNFDPQLGFVRRPGRRLVQELAEFRPHFERGMPLASIIRDATVTTNYEYATLSDGRTETKSFSGPFGNVEFQDGGTFSYTYYRKFDRLTRIFPLQGLQIPAGDYRSNGYALGYTSSRRRLLSASVNLRRQDFYTGTQVIWTWGGILRASYRLSTQLDYQRGEAELREGSFTTNLASLRTDYSFNPRLSLSALIQYNSDTRQVSSNLRFRFIHHPLSDFYVVYNDQRDTNFDHSDRSLTFKFTHLLSF